MSKSLAGKNAIITGGSRGIGKAIALELASRGANILITYNAAKEKAEEVVKQIQSLGVEASATQATGIDIDAPAAVVRAAVQQWKTIDIIINNAGAGDDILIADLEVETWSKIFDTNVRFPVFLVRASLPHLGPAPRVVNISSVMSRLGGLYSCSYTASKAALEASTKVMAQELGRTYNATFNCVAPGPTDTDLWAGDAHPDVVKEWEWRIENTPCGDRVGKPEEIAATVAWLCEDGSRWVQGQCVGVNGGLFMA